MVYIVIGECGVVVVARCCVVSIVDYAGGNYVADGVVGCVVVIGVNGVGGVCVGMYVGGGYVGIVGGTGVVCVCDDGVVGVVVW